VRTIHVERRIPAPPERVFELLADHAAYDRFRPIDASELVSEGEPPPNGIGAMRRIRVGPIRFEEEITAYEPSTRLDYLIVRLNVPFDHQGGSIRMRAEDGGTQVDWTSTYRVPIPVIGGLSERVWAPVLTRGFRRVLEDVERMAS
jgi:ribosome-associated toxin RatA of RatAB toxin-antitoxin module